MNPNYECEKSQIFRYRESSFFTNGRLGAQKSLTILKRESCNMYGCFVCRYLKEELSNMTCEHNEFPVLRDEKGIPLKNYYISDGMKFRAELYSEEEVRFYQIKD